MEGVRASRCCEFLRESRDENGLEGTRGSQHNVVRATTREQDRAVSGAFNLDREYDWQTIYSAHSMTLSPHCC